MVTGKRKETTMYGSKVGPAAATGLGAGAAGYTMGGWMWTLLALALMAGATLIMRPIVMRRRHAALGMVGGNTSWRKRMHMRRRR